MEDARDGDLRVPLISSLFFIFVLAGGIFLTFYVFAPNFSRPWFPVIALILIGSPWVFWLFTYLYTCFKGCCHRGLSTSHDYHNSRRWGNLHPTTSRRGVVSSPNQEMNRAIAKDGSMKASGANNVGARHVHFGEVVVVESDGSKITHGMDSWMNSSNSTETTPVDESRSS
ncbi:hypothetical protein L6452_36064 [Arctium lappa]|uniref:Uncharacterized protein n=1 Tax=Arctium lappa TaxID=4217 RepID=A0ACB8Y8C7_ARCLA|nr:hypothetical protein L6452_36064 [Arctium lappa]